MTGVVVEGGLVGNGVGGGVVTSKGGVVGGEMPPRRKTTATVTPIATSTDRTATLPKI